MYFINTLESALSKSLGKKIEFDKVFEPIKKEMLQENICIYKVIRRTSWI